MGKEEMQKYAAKMREWMSFPWGMFTECPKCGEQKYCRGKSRHRLKCRECYVGN